MLKHLKSIAENLFISKDERKQIKKQIEELKNTPKENLSSYIESKTIVKEIANEFRSIGLKIIEEKINIANFKNWMNEFPDVVNYYNNHNEVKIEKILEHFLVFEYLDIQKNNIYIDIAACNSPFAKILRKHSIEAYEQDLIYPFGVRKYKIGGDASSIPVSDNFADILSLQCAFECFQGNSDIDFIKESSRVLKKGGKLGIVPLYVDKEYFVKTGPKYDKRKINIEKEANWVWRDDGHMYEAFSRHYSPSSFKFRIFENLKNMDGEIIYFTNIDELKNEFKNQRIYSYFMFRAHKK